MGINRSNLVLLALLWCFSTLTLANDDWKKTVVAEPTKMAIYGCNSVLSYNLFKYADKEYYSATCNYPPKTGTVLICASDFFNGDESKMNKVFKTMSKVCEVNAYVQKEPAYFQAQYENATKYLNTGTQNASLPVWVPFRTNQTVVRGYYEGYKAMYSNYQEANYYGGALLSYFGLVMLISAVGNFLNKMGLRQKINGRFIGKLRSYLTIPALIPGGPKTKTAGFYKVLTSLLPDRLEFLICFGFFILHLGLWFRPYDVSDDHLLYASWYREMRRFIADRCGIYAFALVPLLVLFAGRNNFLTFVTGFQYTSFIQFHKVVSRFMMLNALVHGCAYTVQVKAYYSEDLKELYFACGVAALAVCGGIMLFSLRPFREYAYELFLYSHIAMVVAFIVLCWYHARDIGYCQWLVAACVLWVFDRVVRLLRVCMFGFHKAELELIGSESFKVTIEKPKYFSCSPGQYGFVYFSDPLLFFQSHPFTMLQHDGDITFFIKQKRGITSRVYKQLVKNGGTMKKWVTLEGPYGHSAPASKYDNVLLLAGGSGVPGVIHHALNLSQLDSGKLVKFVWINQKLEEINYMMPLLMQLRDTRVEVELYFTKEQNRSAPVSDTSSEEKEKFSKSSSEDLNFIKFVYARPDVESLLTNDISQARGTFALITCGAPGMVDSVRHVVSKQIAIYHDRLDYYEELQTW